jgi:long-chain fatty acid transport protein
MTRRTRLGRSISTLGITLALLAAAPALPAGFAGPDPGIKAMGMAGAFTAQANDPSAIYFNPGGLALFKKGKLTVGGAGRELNELQYQGLAPGVGEGTTGAENKFTTWPVHAYAVQPLGPTLKLGLGVSSPYSFKAHWDNAGNSFPGRFLSKSSELQTYDTSTVVSWKASPGLGLGAGVIYRNSKLTHAHNLSGLNPATGLDVDIASLDVATDYNQGFGWQAGLLNKIGKKFSWGFTYRSPIGINHKGAGRLTQISTGNSQLDELNRATLPYDEDLPIATTLDYPASAALGLAYWPSDKTVIETDVDWTGWSRFKGLAISFPTSSRFDSTLQGAWDDALAYRLGARFTLGKGLQVRLGYAFEESPQPDASTGPFLPDAARSIFSAGIGMDWLDIAFQVIAPENRIIGTNADDFNGAYSGNAYMLGISVTK